MIVTFPAEDVTVETIQWLWILLDEKDPARAPAQPPTIRLL